MSATKNRRITLAARPSGLPKPSDWKADSVDTRAPDAGEVLVKVLYLSVDPARRRWISEAPPAYIPPIALGEPMRAGGIGVVVESNDPAFAPGEHVFGWLDVQEYATLAAATLEKVDATSAPLTTRLNVLGAPGMTAYFGLLEVGRPKAGETVVVSGAAGAVGMTAGQIAKIYGCRVVGIAGGSEKCRFIREDLGFDAAIDYKAGTLDQDLRSHCPEGIDVYFDNVGGATLDACLARLALHARVVICGAISQYNATTAASGPKNYLALLSRRASMQGMLVFDYRDRFAEAAPFLAAWIAEGKLKSVEHIVEGGVAAFPEALLLLFNGGNVGKLLLRIAEA